MLVAAACSGKHAANGSIPIKTVREPTRTEAYSVPSSAMEPTLHCAQPAPGCEAAAPDRVVVQEPARALERGEVVAFKFPHTGPGDVAYSLDVGAAPPPLLLMDIDGVLNPYPNCPEGCAS